MSAPRTMRADARKNYEALVKVARRHLSNQGVTTSLEAIAREAGVGVGTLYRHFPDRDHLLFAALNAQGEELRGIADLLRNAGSGDGRLGQWLAEVEKYLSSYQGLPDSIAHALECDGKSPLAITCQEIIALTDEFLVDAQRHGTVREGVTGQALFESALMVAWLGSQLPNQDHGLDGVRDILRHGYRA